MDVVPDLPGLRLALVYPVRGRSNPHRDDHSDHHTQMMPEPRNPHHGNAATGSNKDIAFHAWERANAAWHEWLDSPEARDRVADALFEQWPDDDGQGVKVWADPRTVAQAALDALRDPA